ncbi:MAG: cysteinyl-tRNA synthetase [Candidatus Phytoplasma solani]
MLQIYNSLTCQKQPFISLKSQVVNMYVCGPTVYDHLHLGNIRPLVFFATVKSYLETIGFNVNYVVNITDIDDKIISQALKMKTSEVLIAQKYILAFQQLLKDLDLQSINFFPQATNYIPAMIELIEDLLKLGFAYFTNQGIYFRISKISDYGKLKKQDLSQLKQNARKILDSEKENPGDFILWKKTSQGIQYESPWFLGRPGWHTECVTMIETIFKTSLDIHGGGSDLKFPHHENEIAQAQARHQRPLANFFMHVARLDYKQQKMSKSLGNIVWCKDLLQQFSPSVIKFFLLSIHYRKPIDFSLALITQAQNKYHKIMAFLTKNDFQLQLKSILTKDLHQPTINAFHQFMQDDFSTHKVFDLLEQIIKQTHQTNDLTLLASYQNTLIFIFNVLGLKPDFKQANANDLQTYALWQEARKKQAFQQADLLRQILFDKGLL